MGDTITAQGLTCPDCGRFVPQGKYHVCGTEKLATTVYNTVAGPDMQRIAAALERIAVAMERAYPRPFEVMGDEEYQVATGRNRNENDR